MTAMLGMETWGKNEEGEDEVLSESLKKHIK